MKKKILLSFLVLITFLCARYLKYFYAFVIYGKEKWNALDDTYASTLLTYSQFILVLLVCVVLFKRNTFNNLGLNNEWLTGLKIGFICSLPMFLGYGFMTRFNFSVDLSLIHRDFILAGFFEEFLFRGFLFGILFYVAGWGFFPAILVPSIYFGLGHLYQAENWNEVLGIFLFTSLGSIGFAWFYIAWKNLWVVIFLHSFMDFAWDAFQIETNVTGNLMVNVFRFATLGLMIFLSLRKLKENPENNLKGKLWIHRITPSN